MPSRLPFAIRAWFALDLVLALAPPLHWSLGGPHRLAGIPVGLAYLWATSLIVAASVVAAYFTDSGRNEGA